MAIHLCIGQAYALSAFYQPVLTSGGGWVNAHLGRIFTLAMVMLGLAASQEARLRAKWGTRTVTVWAALLFCGGLAVAGLAIQAHQVEMLYLGYGLVAGCGMGLGYVAPMQMLHDGFPERRGLVTGVAITAFGGGAMLATVLSSWLLHVFGSSSSRGMGETFISLAVIYAAIMLSGARAFHAPEKPIEWTGHSLDASHAQRTPQFYLLWLLLLVNVFSGISLFPSAPAYLSMAMGRAATATEISGFIALLSLSNMAGRFLVSAASDHLGRKNSLNLLLLAGTILYASVPSIASHLNLPFTVLEFMLMIAIYGGIFALMPAYIADYFGPRFASAIHGRVLTAWSVGAMLSFAAANWFPNTGFQSADRLEIFEFTSGLFLAGLVLNALLRPAIAADAVTVTAVAVDDVEVSSRAMPSRPPASWLMIIGLLIIAIGWTVHEASTLPLSGQLGITLLPLIIGGAVCLGFYLLDRSRFAVKGVAGPYFTALALLFGLYASLTANEVWQRNARMNELLDKQVIALHSMVSIGASIAPADARIAAAVREYIGALAVSDHLPPLSRATTPPLAQPLAKFYRIAADAEFFKNHGPQQTSFVANLEALRVAYLERTNLRRGSGDSTKIVSLLIFGFLTQIAIGFCHAGNQRAISTTVMLFSLGFSAAVAIMSLMDGAIRYADAAESLGFLGLRSP